MADLVVTDLNRKIAKLDGRSDAAANFARSRLVEYRDRLIAEEKERDRLGNELGGKLRKWRDAQAALGAKRAELEAAMQEALAPLVKRERDAAAACERGRAAVHAHKFSTPPAALPHAFVFANAGDTSAIAELADLEARHVHHNRIAAEQLALNQRHIGADEMVCAILAEADHDHPAAWAMFHARWRYWCGANGVDPGAIDQHYGPEVMGTVKRALTHIAHIARSIDRVL